jgi:hypothetical protein
MSFSSRVACFSAGVAIGTLLMLAGLAKVIDGGVLLGVGLVEMGIALVTWYGFRTSLSVRLILAILFTTFILFHFVSSIDACGCLPGSGLSDETMLSVNFSVLCCVYFLPIGNFSYRVSWPLAWSFPRSLSYFMIVGSLSGLVLVINHNSTLRPDLNCSRLTQLAVEIAEIESNTEKVVVFGNLNCTICCMFLETRADLYRRHGYQVYWLIDSTERNIGLRSVDQFYLAPAEYFGFQNCDSFGEVFCHG